MTHGKNICKQLKEVRKRIAEENNIPLEIEECTYRGECRGTCPRCEAEVRYLENALADRLRLGKVATVAGLALGLASCGNGTSSPNGSSPLLTTDTTPADADTIRTTDTAQPVWREPEFPDDIYLGGDFDVLDISDTQSNEAVLPDDELVEGEIDDDDWLFVQVDEDPEFPGGEKALYKFIEDNMQYPRLAAENGISGKVYVSFGIDTDGSVRNPRLLRDIGGGCGAEAIRIVKMMPKWKPGKQQGKAVRMQYNLPVVFDKKYCIPLIEGQAPVQGMPIQDVEGPDLIGPNGSTQEMEVEGVKVIVR
jgi:TonB family protein